MVLVVGTSLLVPFLPFRPLRLIAQIPCCCFFHSPGFPFFPFTKNFLKPAVSVFQSLCIYDLTLCLPHCKGWVNLQGCVYTSGQFLYLCSGSHYLLVICKCALSLTPVSLPLVTLLKVKTFVIPFTRHTLTSHFSPVFVLFHWPFIANPMKELFLSSLLTLLSFSLSLLSVAALLRYNLCTLHFTYVKHSIIFTIFI